MVGAAQAPDPSRTMAIKINPELLTQQWSARWIAPSEGSPLDFGVHHFRRALDLKEKPSRFVVHVTGDNRYQLFVNGERVVWGPARGDLFHWRYETVDLAPYLRSGKNVLAAVVWNYGQYAPEAQQTVQSGFLLQGDGPAERAADTGAAWRTYRSPAYQPIHYTHAEMRGYFVVGPGERIDGAKYPWGWERPEYDDSAWAKPAVLSAGAPRDTRDGPNRWMLVPRSIPLMEEKPERLAVVRETSGVQPPAAFPRERAPFRVPARTKARLLLDQSYLTTGYPELVVSGGKGAVVSLGYAESLYQKGARRGDKGNRNEVEGKEFVGYRDVFTLDGGANRLYRPLWWRTYRYIDVQVETQDEPLTVEDLRGVYTGYPFRMQARFETGGSENARLQRILEVGWRTARLCAHETYMDCPYYEQLQYVGDTRIQCLISLYNSGDARLMKNAIAQMNDSRTSEGATMSRFPTRQQQYIPSFSLWWIGMVHDYWRYVDDPDFAREMLPGIRSVLSFFQRYEKADGSLGLLPWWNYVDWANEWRRGVPPATPEGSSAPFDLQLLLAYDWAADLESALGNRSRAGEDRAAASRLRKTIRRLYWDQSRGLFADTPEHKEFSQQTNVLAVLAGVVKGREARRIVEKTLADRELVQCSYYFHEAVNRVGLGDRYLDLLGEWQSMLDRGLTTWAERPEGATNASRSDCHAWSAHPNFELFRTVLGIDSAAPGFSRVVIRPHPGKLERVSGTIPHPRGEISVRLVRQGDRLEADLHLPEGVTGDFIWNGKTHPVSSGSTRLKMD